MASRMPIADAIARAIEMISQAGSNGTKSHSIWAVTFDEERRVVETMSFSHVVLANIARATATIPRLGSGVDQN